MVRKKDIEKKIEYLREKVGAPLSPFVAADEDLLWIQGDCFNIVAIHSLVSHIMIHLKARFVKFNIDLCFDSEATHPGEYSSKNGIPTLNFKLNRDYTANQIIAIVCHECTHHFLLSKGIWLQDEYDNEVLTDIAAVYLGFGTYLIDGYRPIEKTVFQSDNYVQRAVVRIGYISSEEIEFTLRRIDALSYPDSHYASIASNIQTHKQYDKRTHKKEEKKILALKEGCDTLEALIEMNKRLVESLINSDKKIDSYDIPILQSNLEKIENSSYIGKLNCFHDIIEKKGVTQHYKKTYAEIEALCTEIAVYNKVLGRYL